MSNIRKLGNYILGALPSPPDNRDYSVVAMTADYPENFSLSKLPSIMNQEQVGSCVAHSIAYSYGIYHNSDFSTDFIYGYRPEGYYQGSGMIVREALKTANKLGDTPKRDLSSNTEVPKVIDIVNSKINQLKPIAAKTKISKYARIYNPTEIQFALTNGMPVIIIMNCYNFEVDSKTGILSNSPNDSSNGSHAMCIVGWETINKTLHFIIANSWSSNWGLKGFCKVPVSLITDSKVTIELWSVASEKNEEKIRITLRSGIEKATKELAILISKLIKAGIMINPLKAGLNFNKEIENAVRTYQVKRGLIVDGIVGPKTWAMLDKE